MIRRATIRRPAGLVAMLALLLASCGGGGGNDAAGSGGGSGTPAAPASVFTPPAQEALSATDVERILAQSVAEAQARGDQATIAVTDRVGNVLAIYAMGTSDAKLAAAPLPSGGAAHAHGLQGRPILPFPAVAVAKAITGAYLSSAGNAFSTRTASEIVQEHFPPAPQTPGLESGPLFGVQFSSLPCSDLVSRASAAGAAAMIGPKRSPLGLSADPGGMPLYRNGVVVGGVGVEIDGSYADDPDITDVDTSDEEYVALAGLTGFEAPGAITADKITVDGTSLRYTDATVSNLKSAPASAPAFGTLGAAGHFVSFPGYYTAGAALAGAAYGSEASGIRHATTAEFDNPDAFVLSNGSGANRYPAKAGADAAAVGTALSATEVRTLLEEAFKIMARARGQIRRPLDSRAQVTISVVDTYGDILGVVRGPDAPIFGTDVSLQKARTAAFFSGSYAGAELAADTADGESAHEIPGFVAAARTFFNDQTALTGKFAFSDRAGGNISRPFFPDGQVDEPNGPFSRPIADFNPFSTGLQSALVFRNLAAALTPADTPPRCTALPDVTPGHNRLQNGIQIFPGSVPVYRGGTLVGGMGVSGDGIDQDDMISFLGTYNAGVRVGGIGLPAAAIRADQIVVTLADKSKVRLRFINCPFAPFLDTNDQNVCEDK